ncbi:MAG: hypothetical protein JKY82_01035 [Rhizobiaceae bacterium]|nr:hypothetical protein [Rhizobiaceae bacterium]
MTQHNTQITKFDIDTSGFKDALKDMNGLTRDFGRIFTSTMKTAVVSGATLEDSLRSIALKISGLALNKALAPLETMIGSFVGNLTNAALGSTAAASGPIGIGLQSNQAPANISFHVNTADAASFKHSEGQISSLLARTVSRGQRRL